MNTKKQRNDVSIIIVNYNTKHLLNNCIKSIYEQTNNLSFEIIVVDNNSSDNSNEFISSKFPKVKFIQLENNVGFGNANNAGIEYVSSKYVLFLNSDTVLKNDAIALFFDYFETHNANNDIGAIGGFLVNEHEKVIHSFGRFPNLYKDLFRMVKDRLYKLSQLFKPKENDKTKNDVPDSILVDYITGADLFMPVEVFKKLQGFDKHFFMFFEETDLQFRMYKKGLKRLIVKGPVIIHLEGGSFDNPRTNLKRRYYDRSMLYFYSKNLDYFSYCVLFFVKLMNVFSPKYTFKENAEYFKIFKKIELL